MWWKTASFAILDDRRSYDFLVTNFTSLPSHYTSAAKTWPRTRKQFRISGR